MRLIVNGRFLAQPVTGVQRYAREVMAALDRNLHQWPDCSIEMLVPKAVHVPSYERIKVRQVGRLRGHAWEQLELPRYVRGDVLFCPANTAPVATLMSRQAVVVTVHDLSYRYFPTAYTRAFRLLYNMVIPVVMRRAASIITVSHAERRQILRYYPLVGERLAVVPNGGAPERTGEALTDLKALQPYLLYVGSFSRRKNFDGVLATAHRLLAERSDLRMVLVGGTPDVLRQVDPGTEPHPRMVFVGQINDPVDLLPYYSSAEVLLFPSFYESSGLPPVEAMACGCPVIASELPALVERCGSAALYCSPENSDDIYRQTVRLLDDPVLRSALIKDGLERCLDFTWEKCAQQTMELIVKASTANE